MKKLTAGFLKKALLASLIFGTMSCEIQPSLSEKEKINISSQIGSTTNEPNPLTLTSVTQFAQINMNVSPYATGDVTVELRSADSTLLGVARRYTYEMASKGKPTWYTFSFNSAFQIQRGTKLKLYVKRSDQHNAAANNTIYISTSLTDVYTLGTCSLGNKDFSFLTYDSNSANPMTDQRQLQVRDRNALDVNYAWQEFEVGQSVGPAVSVLTGVSLNMNSGLPASALVELSITNTQGTEVLTSVTNIPPLLGPPGIFMWNYFPFTSPLIVSRGQKYRIQVTQKSLSPSGNPIMWGVAGETCDSSSDFYRHGVSSRSCDFSFQTYNYGGVIDQTQPRSVYPSLLVLNVPQWQEFVPGAAQ